MYRGLFVGYVFDNPRNLIIAGALTYLWSLGGSPVGYTALMKLLKDLGVRSADVLYSVINKLVSKGLVEKINVGVKGTRTRYVPTRHLILELMLNCPWESSYGCSITIMDSEHFGKALELGGLWRDFIEWFNAFLRTNELDFKSPLARMGFPDYFWQASAIKKAFRSRDEYINELGLTLLIEKNFPGVLVEEEFVDEHVREYMEFLKWLVGAPTTADLQDRVARVTFCHNDYASHFNEGVRMTEVIRRSREISEWLSDSERREFERILNKAYERARLEYKALCEKTANCVESRYEKRLAVLSNKT